MADISIIKAANTTVIRAKTTVNSINPGHVADRLDATADAIQDVMDDVATHETEINTAQTEINTLQSEVSVLQNDVGNIQLASIIENRIHTDKFTAFGIAGQFTDGTIVILQREATVHTFEIGGKVVMYKSTDAGKNYVKTYPSLADIPSAASLDVRNYGGGIYNDVLYLFVWAAASNLISGATYLMKSTDKGVSFTTTLITFTGSYLYQSPYGNLVNVGNKLLVPFYGESAGAVSKVILLETSTTDPFATYTERVMATGNTGNNYPNETTILPVGGTNVIAIARKENDNPILLTSTDSGTTWNLAGEITATTTKWQCPILYEFDGYYYCVFADRTSFNMPRIKTNDPMTLAAWSASVVDIIHGALGQYIATQNEFGYPFVIGPATNPYIVFHEISILDTTPNLSTDVKMDSIVQRLHNVNPKFSARTSDVSWDPAGVFITLDRVAKCRGMVLSADKKSITIGEDGMYAVSGCAAAEYDAQDGSGVRNRLIFTRAIPTVQLFEWLLIFSNTETLWEGSGFGLPDFISLVVNGVVNLRKGDVVGFYYYHDNAQARAYTPEVVSNFSIVKL